MGKPASEYAESRLELVDQLMLGPARGHCPQEAQDSDIETGVEVNYLSLDVILPIRERDCRACNRTVRSVTNAVKRGQSQFLRNHECGPMLNPWTALAGAPAKP
jgi:hypothetical protein